MTTETEFAGRVLFDQALELGEGPSYDPDTGTAWWFNILGRELHSLHLDSGKHEIQSLPFLGSVLARVDGERQVVASDQGLFLRHRADGRFEKLLTIEDNPNNRSNDGRVHQSGALWIGTMGRKAAEKAGSIYHVARGKVTRLIPGVTIPNAICFAPDGATAYYSDTMANRLYKVALDPATGLPTAEPELLAEEGQAQGGFDGAVCDAQGRLWIARWGAGAVDVYDPESGQRLERHRLPASQTSCPAFIGAKADRLLVTSAYEGMDAAARQADPHAGQTFELGRPVEGRFEPAYIV
ncbi:gluconolaconase [Xaviernesmea oryzae]|uniref:Gluconolaconase n=1 Tax=Xaviernesmea oryzae TaxID=464029 RepID=A0A1Q9ATZ0_9HYPH|nr:SMP-30/gluconolactonase/LRE family protein [Xaviernesmea oryzae]OLP58815.1 gluconolaconase [Xaviernesmea oryzae]SEK70854.1 Sugar lactone lactonase YvrE [Xaviernesmea oryzae]